MSKHPKIIDVFILHCLQLHVWWIDAKNYVEFTRPWYAKALQFPLNYFIPGRWHREAELRVEETRGGSHMEPQEVTNRVSVEKTQKTGMRNFTLLAEFRFFFLVYLKNRKCCIFFSKQKQVMFFDLPLLC